MSSEHHAVVNALKLELERQAATIWATNHKEDPFCRKVAHSRYGGFYGPFRELSDSKQEDKSGILLWVAVLVAP